MASQAFKCTHTHESIWRKHTLDDGMRAAKGLVLPRARHTGEIALAGLHCLRSTLAAAPVLFAHSVVTEIKHK